MQRKSFGNMMRNLGGAVGIAACGAILNARTNFHFDMIASHLTPPNGPMRRLIAGVAERHGGIPGSLEAGNLAALKTLRELACREASTLAYADAFRAILLAFIAAPCSSRCSARSRRRARRLRKGTKKGAGGFHRLLFSCSLAVGTGP